MLISFSVGNYLSFKEIQTIDLSPESIKEKENEHFLNIPYLYDKDARVLKSVGIFGHNSHGKSNFIKAYQFFLRLIFTSFKLNRQEEIIVIDNFRLNTDTIKLPTHFEVKFYIKNTKYRYGCKIISGVVLEEWLYYSEHKVRENYLFERNGQEIRVSKSWNKESDGKIDQSIFFTNSPNLLLSVLIHKRDIPRIQDIYNWLNGNIIISNFSDEESLKKSILILSHENFRKTIDKFIEKADLGFITIIEKIDSHVKNRLSLDKDFINLIFSVELEKYELYTRHDVYDSRGKIVDTILFELLKSESAGTLKYLILVSYLSVAIKQGQLIWVDEIDSKFHVLLLKYLLKTFHNSKINSLGSQLVFTCHNTAIMNKSVLRRDQMVVATKNIKGETSIQRLHGAVKPIRLDTQIEKEYLQGKLGGVSTKLKDSNNQQEFNF